MIISKQQILDGIELFFGLNYKFFLMRIMPSSLSLDKQFHIIAFTYNALCMCVIVCVCVHVHMYRVPESG